MCSERGGHSLPWQGRHDSRGDFAVSSIQSNHSSRAWLLLCSCCPGKPCQILPVREHPGGEASPPRTGAGGQGREQEWQELICLRQASASLRVTRGS